MSDLMAVQEINRPDKKLLTSYIMQSFVWGPAFFFPLITNVIKYQTLAYNFDNDGITMSWGRLTRREVRVNYQAIQDIHLRSNLLERWLGLARLEVQTASGEASAELVIEGIPQYNALRDYLLERMQLNRHKSTVTVTAPVVSQTSKPTSMDEETLVTLTAALHEVAAELRALRADLVRSTVDGEATNE